MLGKDTDGSLKEVAEQTRPDSRSSLAELPTPLPQPGLRGDLGRGRHSPWGQQGARAPSRREGRVPDSL